MKRKRSGIGIKSRGLSTIGWLLVLPVVLLILVFGFYEGRKAYWDLKVREGCMKDGGVKVFEIVELNKQEYAFLLDQFGQLSPPLQNRASKDVPVIHTNTVSYIRRNDPEVRRDELAVIRRSDNKILGVSVSYSRVGGDLISLHPSYFSCPDKSQNIFPMVLRRSKR